MAPPAEAELETIGVRLRSARERLGFTMEQTAEVSGLSKAHLSRLESAERQPSIAALLSLSRALGVPVSTLLGEDLHGSPLAISTGVEPRHESKGLSISSCSGYAGSSAMEALRITVNPDRPAGPGARHSGEEWLYVLQGTLRLDYDGEIHHLGPSTTAHFDAERPHRLVAEDGPVEVLLVTAKDSRKVHNVH